MRTDCRYCTPPRQEAVDVLALLRAVALAGRYGSARAADEAERGYRGARNAQAPLPLEMEHAHD